MDQDQTIDYLFGHWIEGERKKKELKAYEAAFMAGFSLKKLLDIEFGKWPVSVKDCMKLADAYKLNVREVKARAAGVHYHEN